MTFLQMMGTRLLMSEYHDTFHGHNYQFWRRRNQRIVELAMESNINLFREISLMDGQLKHLLSFLEVNFPDK